MSSNQQRVIDHENAYWSNIFKKELSKKVFKKYSSYWWQDYYEELTGFIDDYLEKNNYQNLLEAGCGSGKASLLLGNKASKTLLDISGTALQYARFLATRLSVDNASYVNGDLFQLPFGTKSFDFVWNIGVIEHYEINEIKQIVYEMMRTCKSNGSVAVAFPNLHSGPIWKAGVLKKIKILPGYRLDTEKFYEIETIVQLIKDQSKEMGREILNIDIVRFGSPLFMETPAWLIKSFKKRLSSHYDSSKFLIMLIVKIK